MELKTLRQKVKGLTDGGEDRGVSPVIGVILMVAITVILAAVIGAFVLGLGDEMDTGVQAGATISANEDTATVTWNSGGNADRLTVSVDNANVAVGGSGQLDAVGETLDVTHSETSAQDVTITVTAHTENGASSVVQQESVTLTA